jgi:hypothetical protein
MDDAKLKAADYRRQQEARSAMRAHAKEAREAAKAGRRAAIAVEHFERSLIDTSECLGGSWRRTDPDASDAFDDNYDRDHHRSPTYAFDAGHAGRICDGMEDDVEALLDMLEPDPNDEDYAEGSDYDTKVWEGSDDSDDEDYVDDDEDMDDDNL